jgi:hypothetical protein
MWKFESAADAALSNCSIGADAPAARFGDEGSPHGGYNCDECPYSEKSCCIQIKNLK